MALKAGDLMTTIRQFDDGLIENEHVVDALVRAAGLEPAKP